MGRAVTARLCEFCDGCSLLCRACAARLRTFASPVSSNRGLLCGTQLLVQRCLQLNVDLLAGLHGDFEGDALEAGDEVEGSFFRDGFKALGGVGADDEGAVWFCNADGFGIGLLDCFERSRDDWEDELQRRLGESVDA